LPAWVYQKGVYQKQSDNCAPVWPPLEGQTFIFLGGEKMQPGVAKLYFADLIAAEAPELTARERVYLDCYLRLQWASDRPPETISLGELEHAIQVMGQHSRDFNERLAATFGW
jgi:hypothetical protein